MIGLRITDGTTTIDLNNSDPWEVMELDLGYGDPSERETSGSLRLLCNGAGPSAPGGGANAYFSQEFQKIQKLLQQGIDYWRYDQGAEIKDSDSDIVYLEYRTSATDDYYRSPIVKARYNLPNETTWGISIQVSEVEYIIDFMRRNWWEGPEAQLSLITKIETTKTTSAVTVYNPKPYLYDFSDGLGGPSVSFDETGGHYYINDAQNRLDRFTATTGDMVYVRNSANNDGDFRIITSSAAQLEVAEAVTDDAAAVDLYLMGSEICNYVEITAGDVSGDLPSPVRLQFTNDGSYLGPGTASDLLELWIGHWFTKPSPTDNGIVLEAEDGIYDYVDDLMDTADPPGSGGYYLQFTEPFPAAMVTYGTATGGTVGEIYMSASHTEVDGTFDGMAIYIADGTNKGLWRTIVHYNRGSPNSCTITPNLPVPCTTSSKYQIYPAGTTTIQAQELIPISWTLLSEWTNYYKGRYFKAILKLYDDGGSPDDYNYQLRMKRDLTGEVVWEGPIVRYGGLDTDLKARDLGTFRVPPIKKNIFNLGGMYLELVLTPYDGTVTNVTGMNIDYLMLLPVDGFRYYKITSGLEITSYIVDDGYQNFVYYIDPSLYVLGDIIWRGNQIMLQPGIAQRLYFFQGDDIFRKGSVQLWYRPRRLNI